MEIFRAKIEKTLYVTHRRPRSYRAVRCAPVVAVVVVVDMVVTSES